MCLMGVLTYTEGFFMKEDKNGISEKEWEDISAIRPENIPIERYHALFIEENGPSFITVGKYKLEKLYNLYKDGQNFVKIKKINYVEEEKVVTSKMFTFEKFESLLDNALEYTDIDAPETMEKKY
jgi:hypothetical protein